MGDEGEQDQDGTEGLSLNRGALVHHHTGEKSRNISDHYLLENEALGEGTYGTVCKAYSKHTETVRAIKTIKKKDIENLDRFMDEINLMKGLDHMNIIRLYETFDDKLCVYLVLELCEGGELFDRIIDEECFTELAACVLMRQMFSAVLYLHNQGIMHRDLKPENFLFLNDSPEAPLKIIDFGLAKKFKTEGTNSLQTRAGTPYYVAPEVMEGKYSNHCDVWSLGVIMYVLLSGYPPFAGDSDAEILRAVKKGAFNFASDEWRGVSKEARELIVNMLKLNPGQRYTCDQALNSPWIKQFKTKTEVKGFEHKRIVDQFRVFRNTSRMKKIALTVIATQLSNLEVENLRSTFAAMDANGDGSLTFDELRSAMSECNVAMPDDLEKVMKSIDSDRSGVIDYTEFIAATIERNAYIKEDACWAAFRTFDLDGDGVITKEELRHILTGESDNTKLKKVVGDHTLAEMISEVDENGDGQIDFDEFMAMMQRKDAQSMEAAATA